MVKPHVEGGLRAVLKVGVPKGLDTKAIALTEVGAVIRKEPDVHPEVGLVVGTGNHLRDRYGFARRQGPVTRRQLRGTPSQKTQLGPGQRRLLRLGTLGGRIHVKAIRQHRVDPDRRKKALSSGRVIRPPAQFFRGRRVVLDGGDRPRLDRF